MDEKTNVINSWKRCRLILDLTLKFIVKFFDVILFSYDILYPNHAKTLWHDMFAYLDNPL